MLRARRDANGACGERNYVAGSGGAGPGALPFLRGGIVERRREGSQAAVNINEGLWRKLPPGTRYPPAAIFMGTLSLEAEAPPRGRRGGARARRFSRDFFLRGFVLFWGFFPPFWSKTEWERKLGTELGGWRWRRRPHPEKREGAMDAWLRGAAGARGKWREGGRKG